MNDDNDNHTKKDNCPNCENDETNMMMMMKKKKKKKMMMMTMTTTILSKRMMKINFDSKQTCKQVNNSHDGFGTKPTMLVSMPLR